GALGARMGLCRARCGGTYGRGRDGIETISIETPDCLLHGGPSRILVLIPAYAADSGRRTVGRASRDVHGPYSSGCRGTGRNGCAGDWPWPGQRRLIFSGRLLQRALWHGQNRRPAGRGTVASALSDVDGPVCDRFGGSTIFADVRRDEAAQQRKPSQWSLV